MSRSIKITAVDSSGTARDFQKGIKLVLKRELYTPFVSLSGEFICDSAVTAAQICELKLYISGEFIYHGIPDKVTVAKQGGLSRIVFSSRSYTSLTAQNEPEPGIMTDVTLSSLVRSSLDHPYIVVEENTPTENYISIKNTSTLWDAIIAYNLKQRSALPYIYARNTIMSTRARAVTRDYTGERILSEGFGVNTMAMLSDLHMRIGDGEYDHSFTNPYAASYKIIRSRYYDLDYQWLHDIDRGLAFKAATSNRKRNFCYFEYPSFRNEQLFDRVTSSGTVCDGKLINSVVITFDRHGARTRITCYEDDLGQV